MSSHHIVRENQEPALLIQSFDALDIESIGQLLEWSPTLVTDDNTLDCLLAEGIKVDVLFSKSEISLIQEHTKFFAYTDDFIKSALMYLISNNHKAVNILSSYLPSDLSTFAKDINIVLFYNTKRFSFVKVFFEKWKPKGEFVYVEESQLKSFQGLIHIDKNRFETISDGFFQIEFNSNDFVLIGEDL